MAAERRRLSRRQISSTANWSLSTATPVAACLKTTSSLLGADRSRDTWNNPRFTPPLRTFFTVDASYAVRGNRQRHDCSLVVSRFTRTSGGFPAGGTAHGAQPDQGAVYRLSLSADGTIRSAAACRNVPHRKPVSRHLHSIRRTAPSTWRRIRKGPAAVRLASSARRKPGVSRVHVYRELSACADSPPDRQTCSPIHAVRERRFASFRNATASALVDGPCATPPSFGRQSPKGLPRRS